MSDKKQERRVTFMVNNSTAIYLGYHSQMTMLPVKAVKYKNTYIKQIKLDGYCPANSICRETMISYIITQLSNTPCKRTIDMLIIIPNNHKDDLDKGIKLINHYERLLNWNKTYAYDVNNVVGVEKTQRINDIYKKFSFVLVVIPNKWLYSPQLISLYLMFLKIAEIKFECKFKTHEELMSQLDTFFDKKMDGLNGFMCGFYYRVKQSYKYWDIFLHNLDILFKNNILNIN